MGDPILVLILVKFEFQTLVNDYLRSNLGLFPSVESKTSFSDILFILLPLINLIFYEFLFLFVKFPLRLIIHILV